MFVKLPLMPVYLPVPDCEHTLSGNNLGVGRIRPVTGDVGNDLIPCRIGYHAVTIKMHHAGHDTLTPRQCHVMWSRNPLPTVRLCSSQVLTARSFPTG